MISDKMVEAAFRSEMPDALSRVISRRHIRALLTAALSAASCNCPGEGRPAASGVHPDALPDGTLSKSTVKRVTALASASVSERARELLAAEFARADMPFNAADCARGEVSPTYEPALRAIEQALTQQRGECYCQSCKGSGEVIGLHASPSGDPQDAYEAPMACPKCDGTGDAK